jgi:hypothetical protein
MDICHEAKLISANLVVLAKKRRIRNICWFTVNRGADLRCLYLSFVLIQKKQKIKENTIAPRVFPCLRAAKAVACGLKIMDICWFTVSRGLTFNADRCSFQALCSCL